MTTAAQIHDFAGRIAEQFSPEKIILFGSYASGRPTSDSDVDMLVVMEHHVRNVDKAVEILSAIRHSFPVDLFVRRPEDIKRRVAMDDWFIRDIVEQGRVLYEGHHA